MDVPVIPSRPKRGIPVAAAGSAILTLRIPNLAKYSRFELAPMYGQIVVTFALLAMPADSAEVASAVARHAEALARIETIYVEVKTRIQQQDEPAPREMQTSQLWRRGVRERVLTRSFISLGADGFREIPEESRVSILGLSDRHVKQIRGWDPDHPLELPLDYATHAGAFGRVKCSIGTRNPVGAGSPDWAALLLGVSPGLPLSALAEVSQLEFLDAAEDGLIRLKVVTSKRPEEVGTVIDLDPARGYSIRRISREGGGLCEVVESAAFGDGIWIATNVRRSLGSVSVTAELADCKVNQTISDADLAVDFPEGARVDEPEKGLIHLWGKDGPDHTFTKDTEMRDYLYAHARDVQSRAASGNAPEVPLSESTPIWRSPLLILNLTLLTVLAALFFIRRWMSRR